MATNKRKILTLKDNNNSYLRNKRKIITFHYYTSLISYPDSVCKNYDLVLPGPSCSISFGVKLISCSPLNETGCLSQNHPTEFNPDGTVSYGTTDFKMEFRSQLNDSIHAHDTLVVSTLKYMVYACEGLTMHLHCYGNCDGYPASISDFSFERNSFGWHSDTSFLAGTGHFTSSQSLVGKHRAYINDAIYSTASGSITTPIQSCYTNLNFEISYPSLDSINPVFALDSCRLIVHITSGSHQGFYTYSFNSPSITNALDSGNITQTVHFDMTLLQVAAGVYIDSLFHEADSIHNTISFVGFYHVVCASFLPPGHYMIQRVQAQFTLTPASSGCIPLKSCDPWGAAMDVLVIRNTIECNSHVVGGGYGYVQGADVFVLPEGGYPGEVDFPHEYRPLIEYPSDFDFTLSNSFFLSSASLRLPNSVSYQLYDISGRGCSDTLNPAFGGHCPGGVIGGPYNPGGVIHFHLDTLIHKFAVNSDTVTALPIPTLTYKLQPKGIPYSFYFDVNRTCLPPSGAADWMAHFNFPFQSFSSYDSLQHYFPSDSIVTCNAPTAYAQLDTLYSHVFTPADFALLYNADTLEPLAISAGNIYQTSGDTLVFCADYLSFAPGKASYIYSPDPTVQIVSIEEGVNNCNDNSTVFQHLLTNTAGNLFYLTCTQQAGHLRLKIKFNCIQAFVGYSSTPIVLNYGEFTNRCKIRTLNPDSTTDLALLTSCGIHKRDTIYAQPSSFAFHFTVHADSDSITFCNNDTIRIQYQLGSGNIYNPQLQIVDTAFNASQAQFTLKEGVNTISGSFNGTTDTLTFPLSIHDINTHNLSFVYFPGCSSYNGTSQVFHFTIHGANACGDPIISAIKDTAAVHILYQQFAGSNPFSSLTLKGDSIAGCTSILHDTIRVSYGSFSDSIQFQISSPWLDSTWTVAASGTGDTIPFLLHVTNNTCSSIYNVTVTATLLSHCSPTHSCPIGSAHTAHKNIHVTCLNCCANADSTYTNGSVSPIPGLSYNINQNINISGTITFSHNNMFIAPGVTITVLPSANFHITDSSYLHACNEMWHGIIINSAGGGFILDSGSVIADADTGVYMQKSIPVVLNNCLFTNNYIDAFIDPEAGSEVVVTIKGTTFNGAVLSKAPHNGARTFINLKLNNVMSLDIGGATDSLNIFRNGRYGIYATKSSVSVRHSNFSNYQLPCADVECPSGGIAIYTQGDTSSHYTGVGGSVAERCNFTSCTWGVYATNNVSLNVKNNHFDNTSYTGYTGLSSSNGTPYFLGPIAVYAYKMIGVKSEVDSNDVLRFRYGIYLREISKGIVEIIHNKLNNFNGQSSLVNEQAITLTNVNINPDTSFQRIIEQNTIKHYKKGIFVSKQTAVKIRENNIRIENNVTPTAMWYGIKAQGGNDHVVSNNIISRLTMPSISSMLEQRVYAISIENCALTNVIANQLSRCGTGIRYFTCNGTNTLMCNELNQNVDQVTLEHSNIGDQGDHDHAADNFWTRLDDGTNYQTYANISGIGVIPPIRTWYVQNEPGFHPDYSGAGCPGYICPPFPLPVFIDDSAISSDCVNPCADPPSCLQELIYEIASGAGSYASLDDDGMYAATKFAYDKLYADTSLMKLGTIYDLDLKHYYDSLSATNFGKLSLVNELIATNDTAEAIAVNSYITYDDLAVTNASRINEIYLTSVLDDADTVDLETIAFQNPISGGDAVYAARNLLGIDLDDYYYTNNLRQSSHTTTTLSQIGHIVPNPNTGKMQFIYALSKDDSGKLEILNLRGNILRAYKLQSGNNSLDIDMNDVPAGIYPLRVIVNTNVSMNGKIILQK